MNLPTIPDEDADFTPEIGRKIIGVYQELLRRHEGALADARRALILCGFVSAGPHGIGDPEITGIDALLSNQQQAQRT